MEHESQRETAATSPKPEPDDVSGEAGSHDAAQSVKLVRVDDVRPDGYDGTCLRPLGLCELGGSCDVCWYRPDHPRFREAK